MLTRSLLVSTATATAAPRLTLASTAASVASPITTGTPRARTWPRWRVVRVALDDDHAVAVGQQLVDDPQPDRPQPDDDDVALGRRGPAMPERPGQAGAHQQFGEQREQDGRQHDPAEHQRDGERAQPRRLLGEGEVAVADGGDRLHGEVQGVEHGHVRAVGFDVPEPQHDDRQHGQAQQRQQCRAQRAVGLGDERAQQRAHAGSPAVLLQLDGAGRTGRAGAGGVPGPLVRLGRKVGNVTGRELRGRADGGHPVSGPDGGVATRAHERRRPVPGHRDRRQLAVELAQRRGPVDDQVRDEEGLPGQHHAAGPGAPAGLDDCGYREGGDVEDAVLPGGLGQRAAHRRVAHADDEPHVRPDPPDEQGGLQAPQVVVGDADHRGGGVEPRGRECLARAAGHLRHAPAREEGVGDGIGVVGPGVRPRRCRRRRRAGARRCAARRRARRRRSRARRVWGRRLRRRCRPEQG